MAENNQDNANATNDQSGSQRQISILAQYVKDLSFENPNAPQSLQPSEERPNINVNVDVTATRLNEENFEVVLKVSAAAMKGEESVFISEVSYGGVFVLKDIPQNEIEAALLIYCPSLLFPYARRVISDATRDGGFPALMLDPIDFAKLYMQRQDQVQKQTVEEAE